MLTWYFSPSGSETLGHSQSAIEPGELEVDENLLLKFQHALASHEIELRFFYGGWDSLHLANRADLVLSSETVYSLSSLPSLCRVLHSLCWTTSKDQHDAGIAPNSTLCLVAAKVLYFGVGGGVDAFVRELEMQGGWHSQKRTQVMGVGRAVIKAGWLT